MTSNYRPLLAFPQSIGQSIHSTVLFSPSQLNSCRTFSIPNMKPHLQSPKSLIQLIAPSSSTGILVVCRFRPVNEVEQSYNSKIIAKIVSEHQVDILSDSEFYVPSFQFDRIFPISATQSEIYAASSHSIVQSVLDGYNGTILAYGQTASGKTHTMQGLINSGELQGVIPRAVHQIFSYVNEKSKGNEEHISIALTMIEIYMERVNDLLDLTKQNLNIREGKDKRHYIDDVSEHIIQKEADLLELFNQGVLNRTNGSTQMNYNSSRSHSIVIITISQKNIKSKVTKKGKLYLVDLAGSEKASKTGVTGLNLEEAKNINKSLSTLGLIIKTLTDGTSIHIPYRESKLTRILSESLGGNSKTCLILTCSPSVFNESETLSTLRFGMRAKKIKNKPLVNKELSLAELKEKLEELTQLIDDKNNKIKELEKKVKMSDMNSEATIKDEDNEMDFKECLKDITIIDKDNERVVNELNQKLKEKDSEHQSEIEKLLASIDALKQSLSQRRIMRAESFRNLKIKNVFHTIINPNSNSKDGNSSEIIVKREDKSTSTEQRTFSLNKEESISFWAKDKKKQLPYDYSNYFLLSCVCIIFSYAVNFIIEYA